ncbi:hypothetical protein B0H14DRAFT_3449975 [Mycena olivaceomarginata]|nr:hypothetical protein B0H14DRAFT_3449975 [Mycena olivaceomarginata]
MTRQQVREVSLVNAVATSIDAPGKPIIIETGSGSPTPSSTLAPGIMFDISSKQTANGEGLNRIELSELLMNKYLYSKQDWEVERDALISQASQADLGHGRVAENTE